jgi:ATP-binding cassette subfamily B protein
MGRVAARTIVPPEISGNLAWTLKFVWQSAKGLTVANVAITLAQSLVPLFGLYAIKLLIDAVAAAMASTGSTTTIPYLVALAAGLVLIERALNTVADLVRAAQAHTLTDRFYKILHSKSSAVDLAYYENAAYQDTLHRAQQEAPYRPARVLNALCGAGQGVTSLLAIAALLLSFHWSVPIFLVVAAAPALLLRFRFAKTLYAWSRQQTPTERRAAYFNAMLTEQMHAKELRLFGLGDIFSRRFGDLRDRVRGERIDLLKKRSVAELLGQAAAIAPLFALYGFLAYRAVNGFLTLGDLVMFYQAIQRAQSALYRVLESVAEIYENRLFLSSVQEFLALKPSIEGTTDDTQRRASFHRGIELRNVRFRYPGADRDVLSGVDLFIRKGEHVALVGENGCGKTTLVKLLCRLYDPTGGQITLDGVDLRCLNLKDLRRKIGVVFQDYARYNVSAKENIWFGNADGRPDDVSIQAAAMMAGVHEKLTGLQRGYESVLGKKFEAGVELSGGEWQKIALARAFFRDPELVILDEPSSALDAKAEYEIFEKFHRLFQDRTAILISHRLSTVKMADRICFLEGGVVVEAGSHDELVHRGGKYAHMFEKQARHYR